MAIYRGPGGAGDATNDATSQAILAAASAVAAANSEAEAAASAVSAATSATNAASSASGASTSASNAATSASNAATSATSAATSATTATTKASEASTSATNAANSATAASTSATNAANSATSAASSATTATTQATNASNSATAAATSATNAANSATAAATSETNASNSASAASTSATNAANSATSASTSASTATTQASNAATSATAAATSASAAATSETNAANSASSAATSATNAANSASSASTSATNAANSATAAAASYDSFDDRYLGSKTANPTVDNDGNALLTGALYWNSTVGEMRVYTGSAWVAAYVPAATYVAKADLGTMAFEDKVNYQTISQLQGFRNRIINGAMMIDQRNAGASVTPTTTQYVLDRWQITVAQSSKLSIQQSSTAPAGFVNSTLITSLSAYSVGTSDYFDYRQTIEGINVADLAWGTANAASITLSFWVRSSLTGSFGGAIKNSGGTRSYPFTYAINIANTWEQKSIIIAGDTSGTWLTNNGAGLIMQIGLGVGSTYSGTAGAWASANYLSATGATSVVGTNGATFYITGVQLEKGSTATSFDYRPYGTELALCQRYLPCFTAQSGTVGPLPGMATALTTGGQFIFTHPVPARVPGTGIGYSAYAHFSFSNNDGNTFATGLTFAAGSPNASQISMTLNVSRGATTTPGWIYANNASALIYITGCEL